jgi:hypothetical protein
MHKSETVVSFIDSNQKNQIKNTRLEDSRESPKDI